MLNVWQKKIGYVVKYFHFITFHPWNFFLKTQLKTGSWQWIFLSLAAVSNSCEVKRLFSYHWNISLAGRAWGILSLNKWFHSWMGVSAGNKVFQEILRTKNTFLPKTWKFLARFFPSMYLKLKRSLYSPSLEIMFAEIGWLLS